MHLANTMLYSFLLIIGLSSTIQTSDFRDEQGRTSLINFVIKAEQKIALAKKDVEILWNKYFYKQAIHDGYNYNDRTGTRTPRYTYLPIRRIYTTDADVLLYKEQEDKFKEMISGAIGSIEAMVRFGIDINAKDNAGYTALNYCYTQEIYEVLMGLGAYFQLQVWAYFNPGYTTFGIIGSTAVIGMSTSIFDRVVDDRF